MPVIGPAVSGCKPVIAAGEPAAAVIAEVPANVVAAAGADVTIVNLADAVPLVIPVGDAGAAAGQG